MLLPSQIRSKGPLEVQENGEGVFSFINAYEGDSQEFFEGRLGPVGREEASPQSRPDAVSGGFSLQDTAVGYRGRQGSEEDLRESIEDFFLNRLDPEKEADERDTRLIFEYLKRSGSLCVSQIAIETGLPLDRIFLSLRQLAFGNSVEWRPDKGVVGIRKILQQLNATQIIRDWPILIKCWRDWRKSYLSRRSQPVQLTETAWSIMRAWNSRPLSINNRQTS